MFKSLRASLCIAVGLAVGCGSAAPPATLPVNPTLVAPTAVATAATPAPSSPIVPLWPLIKVGKLSNGLTYYIMKHGKPEQRANLWLAVNAGSVLEDDDQRGLAHLTEHMAFNGTKHFEKSAIVDYIEKVGMQFGADVNAYTSFDQTVYMLKVPTDDKAVLSKGIDIIRDWAGEVSFDPVEVEKERGVVMEEWRLGRGAFTRISDKQFPILFQGSKYADRLPIGLPDTILHAPRETLMRFYRDWYRPDNMAVIAVGDFDPAEIEAQIKAKFGDLKNPTQERERAPIAVRHDQELAVTINTDPEMPYSMISVVDKMDHRPEVTEADYRRTLVEEVYHQMFNARLNELSQASDAPFVFGNSSTGAEARTVDFFARFAFAKEGRLTDAAAMLFREIARIERFGFLQSEFDRARADLLEGSERSAKEMSKSDGGQLANEVTRLFFANEEMGGRDAELAMTKKFLPTITLDELNHLASSWGGAHGRVIEVSGPAKSKMPSETELRSLAAAGAAQATEAWKDDSTTQPLMAKLPTPGKIVATSHDDKTDATVWTLSNGIRVVVKPTDFQNDTIGINGRASGGTSVVSDADFAQAQFVTNIQSESGVGALDATALRKQLAGKTANVTVGLHELSLEVDGSTKPGDLETEMQLLYLRLTAPRRDEGGFAKWKSIELEFTRNRRLSPEQSFFEDMRTVLSGNHVRRRPVTPEMIEQVNIDKALAAYKAAIADLGGFTFVMVGNIDLEKLKPLVETYIASLPSKSKHAHWKNVGVKYPTGRVTKTVTAGTEPKSHVFLTFSAPEKWTIDGERDAKILSMILDIRLREVMREDMSGTYGVGVWSEASREPSQRREIGISFGCAPENVDKLKDAAFGEIAKIQKNGIGDEYLVKVREQLRRQHETDLKDNGWWAEQLRDAYWYGDNFKEATNADAMIARVTSANIKASAKHYVSDKDYVLGVLRPTTATATK